MSRTSALLAPALLVFPARPKAADPIVLFNNFGPACVYRPLGWQILGPGARTDNGEVSPGQLVANLFSLTAPTRVTGIDLALAVLARAPVVPVDLTLRLVPDARKK
jgi:hypothetical protein